MVKVKYNLMTAGHTDDMMVPLGSFVVGTTEFGKDPKTANNGANKGGSGKQNQNQNSPVSLEFRALPEHRIEIVPLASFGLIGSAIKPVFLVDWFSAELTAEGSPKGSYLIDSETFRRTYYAAGVCYQEKIQDNLVSMQGAWGSGYGRIDGEISRVVSDGLTLGVGYSTEEKRMDTLRVKDQYWFASLLWMF